MESDSKEFAGLRRLLALKRHEVPPPGFFDQLPERVRAAILAEPRNQPWWSRLTAGLAWRPALAGACALGSVGLVVWRAAESQPNGNQVAPLLALEQPAVPLTIPIGLGSAPSVTLSTFPFESESTAEQPSVTPFVKSPPPANPPPEGLFKPQFGFGSRLIHPASGTGSRTNTKAR